MNPKFELLQELIERLPQEKSRPALLEKLLEATIKITNAGGGALFLTPTRTEHQHFNVEIVINLSLEMHLGGTSKTTTLLDEFMPFIACDYHDSIVHACARLKKIIEVEDVYKCEKYNFNWIKSFDQRTHYNTQSVMAIPLFDIEDGVVGVFQVINCKDEKGAVIAFTEEDFQFAKFLATQATIYFSNYKIASKLESLLLSLAHSLATAIDKKSPHTGKHCERVPELTMMLAAAADKSKAPPFRDFKLSANKKQELELAALLHDCGKVSTPIHVMDKSTKLETIFDRIELLSSRFSAAKLQYENNFLLQKINFLEDAISNQNIDIRSKIKPRMKVFENKQKQLYQDCQYLDEGLSFLRKCNIGSEFMPEDQRAKVKEIAQIKWRDDRGIQAPILSEEEVLNLTIPKGTLTDHERTLINNHSRVTMDMLTLLDFPEHLKQVPMIASSHHERPNGKGHPRGLKDKEISLEARLLCIADIFEALTAKDRPYKKGKNLQETLYIMGKMVESNELDRDVFYLLIDDEIYKKYGEKYLEDYQIVAIDPLTIPSYIPPEQRKYEEHKQTPLLDVPPLKKAA